MKSVALYSSESANGWLPWGVAAPLVCVVLVAAPVVAVSLALEHFGLVDAKGDPLGLTGLFAFLLFPFAGIAIVVASWIRFVERRPLTTVGLAGAGGVQKFLVGLLIGTSMIVAIVASTWLADGYAVGAYAKAFTAHGAVTIIALLLVCFTVQSSVEEFVFRGWLLSAIARKFNIPFAIALTTLTFTFLHYSPDLSGLATFNIILFAVFAGCWVVEAGSIWSVMGWHAGWNGFVGPVLNCRSPAWIHMCRRFS